MQEVKLSKGVYENSKINSLGCMLSIFALYNHQENGEVAADADSHRQLKGVQYPFAVSEKVLIKVRYKLTHAVPIKLSYKSIAFFTEITKRISMGLKIRKF